MEKIQNGNFHYCVFDVCPLPLTWQQRLVGVGALELALHLCIIIINTTSHRCHSGATSLSNIKPLSCLYMPIAATACKYINYTASERGHYQCKCEWDLYPKHYRGTCSHTPVSQVPSEGVCVNRWRYQDVHSVACQPGGTTVVNCVKAVWIYWHCLHCAVSTERPQYYCIVCSLYYGSKSYMWKYIIV